MAQQEDFVDPYEFLGIAPEARSPEMSDVPTSEYQDPYSFLGIGSGIGVARPIQSVTQRPETPRWGFTDQIASGLGFGLGPELAGTENYLFDPFGKLSLGQHVYNARSEKAAFEHANPGTAQAVELIGSLPSTVAVNALTPGMSTLARGSLPMRMGAGALAGAETGLLQSRITGGNPLENAAFGAILQGSMPAPGSALGYALTPRVGPGVVELVRDMEALGVKIRPTQVATSQATRRSDELLASGGNEEQFRQFNRALSRTFGENSDVIDSKLMGQARDRIRSSMDNIAAQTTVELDKPLLQTGRTLNQEMALISANLKGMPTEAQNQVRGVIREIRNSFTGGKMDGKIYQRLTGRGGVLANLARDSHPTVREMGGKLRERLDDAVESFSPPGVRNDWIESRAQLKNLITVQPLVEGNASGVINPQALHGQVKKTFSEYGWGDQLPHNMNTLAEGGRLLPRAGVLGETRANERQSWLFRPSTLLPAGFSAADYFLLSGGAGRAAAVAAGTAATVEGLKASRGAIMRSDWYRNALTGNVSPPSLTGRATRNALTGAVNSLNQLGEEDE